MAVVVAETHSEIVVFDFVFDLEQAAGLGGCVALEGLVVQRQEEGLLRERESSLTGCHCWRDTAGGRNSEAGMEVVVEEEELVQGMSEG